MYPAPRRRNLLQHLVGSYSSRKKPIPMPDPSRILILAGRLYENLLFVFISTATKLPNVFSLLNPPFGMQATILFGMWSRIVPSFL